eukprot:m.46785 g.46785  ORF g.46785 m.46785 type:complete len:203 (-) comp6323_c0_seq4:342-950(-)
MGLRRPDQLGICTLENSGGGVKLVVCSSVSSRILSSSPNVFLFIQFRDNGGCGYVLRPQWMLDAKVEDLRLRSPRKLTIKVLEAFYLSQVRFFRCRRLYDLYVALEVVGIEEDCISLETDTHHQSVVATIDEEFELPIRAPELAVLKVCLKDFDTFSKDDTLGQFSIPLNHVLEGRFRLPMLNKDGSYRKKEPYVAVEFKWE